MRAIIFLFAFATGLLAQNAGDFLNDARTLISLKQYEKAVGVYEHFLAKYRNHPQTAKIRMDYAHALTASGRIYEASKEYKNIAESYRGTAEALKAQLLYARCLEARGEFLKAISAYKDYISHAPEHSLPTKLYVAGIYGEVLGRADDAIREYQELLKGDPSDPSNAELLWRTARIFQYRLGNIVRARDTYAELVQRYPESPLAREAQELVAELSGKGLGQYARAVFEYSRFIQMFPKDPTVRDKWLEIARIYSERLRQYYNSAEAYAEAYNLSPSEDIQWRRAKCLERAQKWEEVVSVYQRFIKSHPESQRILEAKRALFNALWQIQERREDALKLLEKLLAESSDDSVRWETAQRYIELKRYDEAMKLLVDLSKRRAYWQKGAVLSALAKVCVAKGKRDEAEKLLRHYAGKADKPVASQLYWTLATEALEGKKALDIFKKLLSDYRDYLDENKTKEALFKYLASPEEAEGFFGELLKAHPYNPIVRSLGAEVVRLYAEAEKHDKALAVASKLLKTELEDRASVLARLYAVPSLFASKKNRTLLEYFVALEDARTNPAFRLLHTEIDEARREYLAPILRSMTVQNIELKKWKLKLDPRNQGERLKWHIAGPDQTWKEVSTGADWGEYDGVGWFATEIPASTEQGLYRLHFEQVADSVTVYVDGRLVGSHTGEGAFSIPFATDKREGSILIAVKLKDEGGTGGLVGACRVEVPSAPSGEELLLAGMAHHAFSSYHHALSFYKRYRDWLGEKAPAEKLDRVRELENIIYFKQKNYEALRLNKPSKPSTHYLLLVASSYLKQEKPDNQSALMAYEEAYRQHPKSIRTRLALARFYDKLGRWEDAVRLYEALVEEYPDRPGIQALRPDIVNICSSRWKNIQKARTLAQRYYSKDKSVYWARTLGDLFFNYKPQNLPASLVAYRQYYAMTGADEWYAGSKTVEVLKAMMKTDEAIAEATRWLEANPDHPNYPDMLFLKAELLRQKDEPAALKLYEEIVQQYPSSQPAFKVVSSAITALKPDQRSKLVELWMKLNEGNPRSAELYWKLAREYEKQAEGIKEALQIYQIIVQKFPGKYPENVYAMSRLARIYASRNEHSKALPYYEEIITRFGGSGLRQVIDAWFALISYYSPKVKFTVSVDSTYPGFTEKKIIDGWTDGMDGSSKYCWISANERKEHWVECSWDTPLPIERVDVYWGSSQNLPKSYRVRYWDGKHFVDVETTPDWKPAETLYCPHTFKPVTTTAIRIIMKENGGGNLRPNIMEVAEVEVFRFMDEKAEKRLLNHCENIVRLYAGRSEAFRARLLLADYYTSVGKFLDSLVTIQKAIYNSPPNDTWHWNSAMKVADEKMKEKRYAEASCLYRSILRVHSKVSRERLQKAEKYFGDALTKAGAGVAPIDPSAPQAGLLWGNVYALSGDEELAFKKYIENIEIFTKYQHILSPEYIELIARKLLKSGNVTEAVQVCRRFLIKKVDDPHITDEEKASIQLLLGDCYYREERYDLAHDEYRSVINHYPRTPQALEAKFRIGQTLIAQKIYATAERLFRELAKSPNPHTNARAHFMLGVLYHARGQKQKAIEQFKQVLAMQPASETSDLIMYRLGVVYSEERKYKEALEVLRLIGAYRSEPMRLLEPGTELRIRLTDKNLMITRGSADVPMVITTTSGDRELIYLTRSEASPGLFIGAVPSELGEPIVGDRKLQLVGTDVIHYDYAPFFKKDFEVREVPESARTIRIASDAELKASSTEIKAEEEATFETTFELAKRKRTQFRDETQIKPGNFIYVRVIDPDMDITPQPDKVKVTAQSSSGDTVEVELVETDRHSGKFDGRIKTGLKPPDATASDSTEGHNAYFAIDGNKDPDQCWMGARDRKVPKWLTVDLKDLYTVTRIRWHRGEGARDRAPVRYRILYSQDGKTWDVISSVPEAWNYHDRLTYTSLRMRTMPNMLGDPKTLEEMMMMCQLSPMLYGEKEVEWVNDDEGNPFGPSEYYIAVYWGNFYAPETGIYEFATDSDDASFLLIDGKLVAEYPGNHAVANNWSHKGEIFLEKGIHTLTYYLQEWEIIQVAKAAWKPPSGADFEIIPKEFFDPKIYPDILKPRKQELSKVATVRTDPDGMGATITLKKPIKLRYLQMLIREYMGDAPAIAYFAVYGENGEQIIPSEVNVHEVATNDTLEITPGDIITVCYRDERNISAKIPRTLRKTLSATYYNGSIRVIKRTWMEDTSGNRIPVVRYVYRIQPPTTIVVEVEDYDADVSDDIDTIPIIVRSASGKSLELKATETEPSSGVFTKEVHLSLDERPGALQVKEGEWVEVAYEDEYNTDPGNRIERKFRIRGVMPTDALVRVVGVGDKPELYSKEELNKLKHLTLDEPLVVEVYDPDQAFDSGSTVTVNLSTTAGDKQKVTCRIAGADRMGGIGDEEKILNALSRGLFIGSIKLRLGDETSPDTIAEITTLQYSAEEEEFEEAPVLNLSGKDIVTVDYEDRFTSKDKPGTHRYARARLVSDATLQITDDEYQNELTAVHISEKIYIRLEDPDADTSKAQDSVTINLSATNDDKLDVQLTETLSHSGIFTGSVPMKYATKPDPTNNILEADVGTSFTVTYNDIFNTSSAEPQGVKVHCQVIVGTDGDVRAFSKVYRDTETEITTNFKIAECFYELGTRHLKVKKREIGLIELSTAEAILRELLLKYPDSPLSDQSAFLLGKLAQARQDYDEAIRVYRMLVRQFPDSPAGPQAQFNIGVCYQKKGDFERAAEEFVKLFYRYPKSSEVGDARILLGTYFFEKKDYTTALSIFKKFVDAHKDHPDVARVDFKVGLCYFLAELYKEAGRHFRKFIDKYDDPKLLPAALYWGGEAFFKGRDLVMAYRMFKRCVWDFPQSKWARYARGRLTSPAFDRIKDLE